MSDKLLGGKMMDAIQYGGKTYIHEPDVRHAINAALATNGERNARIEALEREIAEAHQIEASFSEQCCSLDARCAELERENAALREALAGLVGLFQLIAPRCPQEVMADVQDNHRWHDAHIALARKPELPSQGNCNACDGEGWIRATGCPGCGKTKCSSTNTPERG